MDATAGETVPDLLVHWEGEPVPVLETLWGLPRLEVHGTLGSTNDRLAELARAGALPFTAVLAEEQTGGRGRGGKAWSSPRGKGLWLSVLLGPTPDAARPLLPILAGLAVCRAVDASLTSSASSAPPAPPAPPGPVRESDAGGPGGIRAALKWPNDVLLGGRKVCGILCEGVGVDRVVVGIGLNVGQRPADFPPEVRGRAVSLSMVAGRPVSRKALTGAVLAGLRTLTGRPTLRLEGNVAKELAGRDVLRGRRVEIAGRPGERLRGVGRGVDAGGRLRVEGDDGAVTPVVAGSVRILDVHEHGLSGDGDPKREEA